MPRFSRSHDRPRKRWRCAALGVAASISAAHPAPVAARPSAPGTIDQRAAALVEAGDLLGAARLLSGELERLPEDFDNRARRNGLAVKAVNAYRLAFDADPGRCEAAAEGVALADGYRRQLLAVYGAPARSADEYVGMSEVQGELERSREDRGCTRETPMTITPDAAPASPPIDAPRPRTLAPVQRPPQTADTAANDRPLVVGLAISGTLTAALLATSLGAGLSRAREPFTGAAYQKIHGAAKASHTDGVDGNEVAHDASTDMCAAGRQVGNTQVIEACDAWTRLGRVTLAAAVGTGVFAITTAALAGVLARNKRRAAARLRAHQPVLGAAPAGRDGLRVLLQWRF